jgi:replication factor C small subunit
MTSEIWTEKYRPQKFSDLAGQEHILKRVEALTNSMNIPHLLFAGPPGTGKSTLALIVVKNCLWRKLERKLFRIKCF